MGNCSHQSSPGLEPIPWFFFLQKPPQVSMFISHVVEAPTKIPLQGLVYPEPLPWAPHGSMSSAHLKSEVQSCSCSALGYSLEPLRYQEQLISPQLLV